MKIELYIKTNQLQNTHFITKIHSKIEKSNKNSRTQPSILCVIKEKAKQNSQTLHEKRLK